MVDEQSYIDFSAKVNVSYQKAILTTDIHELQMCTQLHNEIHNSCAI